MFSCGHLQSISPSPNLFCVSSGTCPCPPAFSLRKQKYPLPEPRSILERFRKIQPIWDCLQMLCQIVGIIPPPQKQKHKFMQRLGHECS